MPLPMFALRLPSIIIGAIPEFEVELLVLVDVVVITAGNDISYVFTS